VARREAGGPVNVAGARFLTIAAALDLPFRIVCTIRSLGRVVAVGQLIMLGTLFGLIVLIFGLVIYFDPEARGRPGQERLR
jgi:hypothetical protein